MDGEEISVIASFSVSTANAVTLMATGWENWNPIWKILQMQFILWWTYLTIWELLICKKKTNKERNVFFECMLTISRREPHITVIPPLGTIHIYLQKSNFAFSLKKKRSFNLRDIVKVKRDKVVVVLLLQNLQNWIL